jgi:phosphohistidine phosphatase
MHCYTLGSLNPDVLFFFNLQQETKPMALKPGYFCRQSGVIPYRVRKGNLEILLITSRKERRWIIPKGIIERDYNARSSAAKEALEEAGVKGGVHGKLLGIYRHRKLGKTCTVKVYPMRVTRVYKRWPEIDRDREWVSLKKALKRVHNDSLKAVIRKLPATI